MKTSDRLSATARDTALSLKSLVKVALKSRPTTLRRAQREGPLIIMGNGPSLRQTMAEHSDRLLSCNTMAVNFAANSPEFKTLKPKYYILADGHFFTKGDPNVERLYENINSITHDMTLIVPRGASPRITNRLVRVVTFNNVGAEGFTGITHKLFDSGLAMPRPRNVMIPAIMSAIRLGYREVYLTGADHTWTRTLSVDDRNRVVSIQPHFYEENNHEKERIASVYENVTIDSILESFAIAFRSYRDIARYASSRNVSIYNATPGSFIDAFERRNL